MFYYKYDKFEKIRQGSRMSSLTFKKGIHPKHAKNFTKDKAIEYVLPEGDVTIMLQQHIGAPCSALVKVGDEVLVGQKIGDSESFVSAPVHSTVSGKVKKLWMYYIKRLKKQMESS